MTGGTLDPLVVERHLSVLESSVSTLRGWQATSVEALRTDIQLQWAVLHGLQLCAQNVLDVATHLAVAAGKDAPDYATAIDRLAELGVLDPGFAASLRSLAGFRNVLVHGYLALDLEIVRDVLAAHLGDFERFAADVRAFEKAS